MTTDVNILALLKRNSLDIFYLEQFFCSICDFEITDIKFGKHPHFYKELYNTVIGALFQVSGVSTKIRASWFKKTFKWVLISIKLLISCVGYKVIPTDNIGLRTTYEMKKLAHKKTHGSFFESDSGCRKWNAIKSCLQITWIPNGHLGSLHETQNIGFRFHWRKSHSLRT